MAFDTNYARSFVNGAAKAVSNVLQVPMLNEFRIGGDSSPNTTIKQIAFWGEVLSDAEMTALTTIGLVGKDGNQAPVSSDLAGSAYVRPEAILRSKSRQEITVDAVGTGTNVTRQIVRPYDFIFEVVDATGITVVSTPPNSCGAGTLNYLTFSGAVGTSITYAITPIFEY